MLRDFLIDGELFEKIREKALEEENTEIKREILEKAVLRKLRKKRSIKKYKKKGVTKGDLKEIIEFATMASLELFRGPSDFEIASGHPEWCSHCGTCCTESSPIFIHKDEINLLLRFNSSLKNEIIRNDKYPEHFMFKEDIPCKFHSSKLNRCKIYDTRPQVCRSYPLVLIGNDDKSRYTLDLRHKCDYAVHLVLEKSMILFDEAVKHI